MWRGFGLDDLVKYRLNMAEEKLKSAKILLEAGQYKEYSNAAEMLDMIRRHLEA
jgi:hypothetical protein